MITFVAKPRLARAEVQQCILASVHTPFAVKDMLGMY